MTWWSRMSVFSVFSWTASMVVHILQKKNALGRIPVSLHLILSHYQMWIQKIVKNMLLDELVQNHLVAVFLLRLYSSTGPQRLINTESKMLFFCSHGLSFIVARIVTMWWKPLWWSTYFGVRGSLITYVLLWWLMETKAQPVPCLSPHHK